MPGISIINNKLDTFKAGLKNHKLYEPIAYILSLDAKRVRPMLFLEAIKVFGGDLKSAMPLAIGIEVFHNFTLLHDDIMDNSDIRRGKPTVHKKWDVNAAILSGDTMMIQAYQLINQLPEKHQPEILRTFSEMALLLCEGQQDDMDFEKETFVELPAYIEMITNKTSVLLAFALQAGAILSGANEETKKTIHAFGLNIGIAFQLQDDYMDLYPKSVAMGKVIGGDLLNKKKALPLLLALQNEEKKAEILKTLNSDSLNRVEELTHIFETIGIKNQCENLIAQYYSKAKAYLSEIEGYDTKIFNDFCSSLHERIK